MGERCAVVTGAIATFPVGGVAWDYGQYVLGLERLGFDVYYLEDTGLDTYDPDQGVYGPDCSYGVRFLQATLASFSAAMAARWHFRSSTGQTFGMEASALAAIVARADVLLNVSGIGLLRDPYMACRRKVLIDTDPGWNHFVNYPRWDARPGWQDSHGYRAHDHFFTYAELIGQPGCRLPTLGITWHPTRPPVIADSWHPEAPGTTWTTVLSWNTYRRPIEYEGRTYGSKEVEFPRIAALPSRVPAAFEIAAGGVTPPRDWWRELGWSVLDAGEVSRSADTYRTYVQGSRGEFSVAKNVYVATRSGWFSCRSVCYLAAGRPVVLQDTGFSTVIPTGQGLFAFETLDDAARAIGAVEADYGHHQDAARDLVRTHFDYRIVLGALLRQIGVD
jgi:hypothetical protein